jgi:bilin biosynthesis protein
MARRETLLAGLRDADPVVQEQAAQALDRLDLLESLPRLLTDLNSFTAAQWVQLLRSLTGLRDETYLKLALRALSSPEEDVRAAALDAVAEIGDWRATGPVCKHLNDLSPVVRARAAATLGQLGDRRGAPHLPPLLEDPEAGVRACAAQALGALGHAAAEAALLRLAADLEPEVRAAAYQALGRIALAGAVRG